MYARAVVVTCSRFDPLENRPWDARKRSMESKIVGSVSKHEAERAILMSKRMDLQLNMNRLTVLARKECVAELHMDHSENDECSKIFEDIRHTAIGICNLDTLIECLDNL